MAKQPKNHREPWSGQQDKELRRLARENTPTRVIGLKLGRTEDAVRQRAVGEGHLPQAHQPVAVSTGARSKESDISARSSQSFSTSGGRSRHRPRRMGIRRLTIA